MRLKGESSKFTLVVFLAFILVIGGVVAASLYFTIRSINYNAEDSKAYLQDYIEREMEGKLKNFSIMLRDPVIDSFFTEGSGGDEYQLSITLKGMLEFSFEEPLYVALTAGDYVVISSLPRERGGEIPSDLIQGGTEMLVSFRDSSGDLIMVTSTLNEDMKATVVKDITTDLERVQGPFDEQKSQAKWTALILFLAFLAFTLFIVLLIILPAQRRYITEPIDELSDAARKIMGEDLSVEVKVDENSDFYYLQAMLDSTKTMIERSFQAIEKENKEKEE